MAYHPKPTLAHVLKGLLFWVIVFGIFTFAWLIGAESVEAAQGPGVDTQVEKPTRGVELPNGCYTMPELYERLEKEGEEKSWAGYAPQFELVLEIWVNPDQERRTWTAFTVLDNPDLPERVMGCVKVFGEGWR
jgi:hypothetical protein